MLLFLIIGIITGIFIGLIGIGSGVILIPALTFAGMSLKEAIATGLFLQAIPQTIPGFYLYYKKGYFKFYESILLLIGSLIGIKFGSYINYKSYISDKNLYRILSFLLIISAIYIYYKHCL